jgi:hypothetical protein
MTNASSERLRRRMPGGLLGMLLLVFGMESYVAQEKFKFTDVYAAMVHYGVNSAQRVAPKCEILFFGDSLVKMGVAAQVVESQLGRRTINLALTGAQPPASYFLFRRAL